MAAETLAPGLFGNAAAQHVWMAGGIGLMTLAVMTRATLGHTGQDLTAGAGTTLIYLALVASLGGRLAAGIWPAQASLLHVLSGLAWVTAFGGFAVLYGPLLLRAKPET
ncbi:MAG: NnrS family protein [Defluviicoccus sp.]